MIDLCYNNDKRVLKYAKEKPKEFIFSMVAAAYGQKAFNEGWFEGAAEKFMVGLEQFPQNLICITGLIDAFTRCQKFDDKTAEICYRLYEMALKDYPDEYQIGSWLATRFIEKQQFELAYKVIEKTITIHRNVKPEDLNMRADMLCLKSEIILSNPKMNVPINRDWVITKVIEAEIALKEAIKLKPDLLLSEEIRKVIEGVATFLGRERRESMPLYKLSDLKLYKHSMLKTEPHPDMLSVSFHFSKPVRAAAIKSCNPHGSGIRLMAWLYDSETPNLNPLNGRIIFRHGRYEVVTNKNPNDPVGELWISYPPAKIETIREYD